MPEGVYPYGVGFTWPELSAIVLTNLQTLSIMKLNLYQQEELESRLFRLSDEELQQFLSGYCTKEEEGMSTADTAYLADDAAFELEKWGYWSPSFWKALEKAKARSRRS